MSDSVSGTPKPTDEPTAVVVHADHQQWGETPDYHETFYVGPLKADRRGHPNPRMIAALWQFWRCNNPDCPGEFFVSNAAIEHLIATASGLADD